MGKFLPASPSKPLQELQRRAGISREKETSEIRQQILDLYRNGMVGTIGLRAFFPPPKSEEKRILQAFLRRNAKKLWRRRELNPRLPSRQSPHPIGPKEEKFPSRSGSSLVIGPRKKTESAPLRALSLWPTPRFSCLEYSSVQQQGCATTDSGAIDPSREMSAQLFVILLLTTSVCRPRVAVAAAMGGYAEARILPMDARLCSRRIGKSELLP